MSRIRLISSVTRPSSVDDVVCASPPSPIALEGKTDYYARKRLIIQAKNKYMTPKYRLVARISNHQVICQIVSSEIVGDKVLCSAYSSELPRYGVSLGLTNFPAAYCTGLLVARRLLKKLNLADLYKGNEKVTGETVEIEEDENKGPFRCVLDIGLHRTTTGAKIFACLKGAVDGGLDIPHSEKRFAGYDREAKEFHPEELRDKIFGKNIAEYMTSLQEEDEEAYNKQFSRYIKAGISADKLEDMYKACHKAIRADPSPAPKKEVDYKALYGKFAHAKRISYEERKERVAKKLAEMN